MQSRVVSAASSGSLVVDRAAVLAMAANQLQETIPEDPCEGTTPPPSRSSFSREQQIDGFHDCM